MPFVNSVRASFGPFGKFNRISFNATGGDIIATSGGYKYHKFNNNGTFSCLGSFGKVFEVIILGAGGNGNSGSSSGPGGGAGALYWNTSFSLTDGNYSINIGQPGPSAIIGAIPANSSAFNYRGGNTTAFGITAVGGGGAGVTSSLFDLGVFGNFTFSVAGDGGSGAGFYNGTSIIHPDGSTQAIGRTVISGTNWYGNNSGDGDTSGGAGGGGAGSVGQTAVGGSIPGNGGSGRSFNWTGSTEFLAGGGGGGTSTAGLQGIGGSGVGGNGGPAATAGTNAVANTGSGGGGSGSGNPGFGSSGTVWIRYLV